MTAESDKLDKAVDRIVQAMQPEAIYLFGSRARGEGHADSDYDLLVIVPDDSPNPVTVVREVISQAMKAGEIPRRNADLAAASAIGVVLQAATYKIYGRFTGDLSAHVRFFADATWAVLAVKER